MRGLLSPSTGIIDSHGLMAAYLRDARRAGAELVLEAPVVGGAVDDAGITLEIGGRAPVTVRARTVVNAAGLFAQQVARSLAGFPAEHVPPANFAKGHYYVLAGRSPFRRLVYPIAVAGGLGVHVTLDLAGQARFAAAGSWLEGVDYSFDDSRAASFYAAIRRYWPALPDGALQPGSTGIRPKLGPAGSPNAPDFRIDGPAQHGVPGLVNLFGIESPGLTASLALADLAVSRLAD